MPTLAAMRPWLEELGASRTETIVYGFCELGDLLPEPLRSWPRAVSFAVRMEDALMDPIRDGPNAAYFAEYTRVNALIDGMEERISERMRESGWDSHCILASARTDAVNIAGEFPHKTAAVRAGLGWIGRNCQLVTKLFGPRVRLGTVLTNMPLGEAPAGRMRSYCGDCTRCVDACPAKALTGEAWEPGAPRDRIFAAPVCDAWKIAHYPQFKSSICGICTAVCPQGTARRKKRERDPRAG